MLPVSAVVGRITVDETGGFLPVADPEPVCGLTGEDLEFFLRCTGQPLSSRIMPLVMQRFVQVAIEQAQAGRGYTVNPLEASLAVLAEWHTIPLVEKVRIEQWWTRRNAAIVERHRLELLEKQGRPPAPTAAPGARGRAHGKRRKKRGQRPR